MTVEKPVERSLQMKGDAGATMGLYFDLVDYLEKDRSFDISKAKEWLEITPQSDHYQDLVQKKANLEQQVSRVMKNLSDMRKQIEMLRHDRRKLRRIIEHAEEGDMDVMKSDFVDLVDRNTEMSLLDLANSGKFPSIVVDFYKIDSEEEIEKLDISKGEGEVLRKKWKLFQDWLNRYVKEIKMRDRMVKEELENKKASLQYYKDMLHPYLKALRNISVQEPKEYKTFQDPYLIERYSSSLAAIELYCWKEMNSERITEYPAGIEKGPFYCFLDLRIERRRLTIGRKERETFKIIMRPKLMTRKDIEEKEKELREREERILQSIGQAKGEVFEEDMETGEEESTELDRVKKIFAPIGKAFRRLIGRPRQGELMEEERKALVDAVDEEAEVVYDEIKVMAGAIRLEIEH